MPLDLYLAFVLASTVLILLPGPNVTLLVATGIILLIAFSRLYLGVHYPSDVIAGIIIGVAWAGFCMAMLEAIGLYARTRAPHVLAHERPPLAQADAR